MALIERRLLIAAPRARVYDISQDYAVRYDWDPFPEKIEFIGDLQGLQRGARVRVIARNGLRMEVQFVQLAPPKRAAIVMTQGPFFLRQFAGSWVFQQQGPGHTLAIFRYRLEISRWALPWLLEPLACWYFGRTVQARLAGLQAYCERLSDTGSDKTPASFRGNAAALSCRPVPLSPRPAVTEPSKNPLHGVTLEAILTELVAQHGWEGLAQRIDIRCFKSDPSIKSSLTFLRKTPWAREKVEALYIKLVKIKTKG